MSAPVIDAAILAELEESAGADFVAELVGTFLEETPALLDELDRARAAADVDAYRRAAHSIKSNSLTFGALALGDLARSIELQGQHADAAQDAQAIATLRLAYAEAAQALRSKLGV
jgi:histidine phosphotransfer protein HptB